MNSGKRGDEPPRAAIGDIVVSDIVVGDIVGGLVAVQSKAAPDDIDTLERNEIENAALKERIKDLQSNRRMREQYAKKIMGFLSAYSATVGGFVVASGIPSVAFSLPDGVLITLVGSTAVAAIGLVGIVVKGLFGSNQK